MGPLVTCVMVTLPVPERRAGFRRALAAYAVQTHAPRELLIVMDAGEEGRAALRADVAALGRSDVRIVAPARPLSLGALRNLSVAAARGDWLCQWDDDDLHHPDRIAWQRAALDASGLDACCLADVMLYRVAERRLFWTNWAATPAGVHPGTLFCRRAAMPPYPETGPEAALGEDLAVALAFKDAAQLHPLAGAPQLYVYVTHGLNVSPAAHHAMLADRLAMSRGRLLRREASLRAGLAPFDLAGEAVHGTNGPAFTL